MFGWVPGLQAVRSDRRTWLAKDIIAGVVLTTLLVPQGMAWLIRPIMSALVIELQVPHLHAYGSHNVVPAWVALQVANRLGSDSSGWPLLRVPVAVLGSCTGQPLRARCNRPPSTVFSSLASYRRQRPSLSALVLCGHRSRSRVVGGKEETKLLFCVARSLPVPAYRGRLGLPDGTSVDLPSSALHGRGSQ
jgi:hypothetical protein